MRSSAGLLHTVLRAAVRVPGLLPVARWFDAGGADTVRVLLYHRVSDGREVPGDPGLVSATRDAFARQMAYCARHYSPISGEQLVAALRDGTRLPPRAVLVTFDDGYRDFLTDAWPILCDRKVPAVLFVPTAFPGTGGRFWWDVVHETVTRTARRDLHVRGVGRLRLRTPEQRGGAVRQVAFRWTRLRPREIAEALRELEVDAGVRSDSPAPIATWEDLRWLAREGATVASHTRTHPSLPTLTAEEIVEELAGAHADLGRELGDACPLFSYPFGHGDPRALPVLRGQGVAAAFTAFTARPFLNTLGQVDPLLLRREPVNGPGSFEEFCLSLTTLYANFRSQPLVRALGRQIG